MSGYTQLPSGRVDYLTVRCSAYEAHTSNSCPAQFKLAPVEPDDKEGAFRFVGETNSWEHSHHEPPEDIVGSEWVAQTTLRQRQNEKVVKQEDGEAKVVKPTSPKKSRAPKKKAPTPVRKEQHATAPDIPVPALASTAPIAGTSQSTGLPPDFNFAVEEHDGGFDPVAALSRSHSAEAEVNFDNMFGASPGASSDTPETSVPAESFEQAFSPVPAPIPQPSTIVHWDRLCSDKPPPWVMPPTPVRPPFVATAEHPIDMHTAVSLTIELMREILLTVKPDLGAQVDPFATALLGGDGCRDARTVHKNFNICSRDDVSWVRVMRRSTAAVDEATMQEMRERLLERLDRGERWTGVETGWVNFGEV